MNSSNTSTTVELVPSQDADFEQLYSWFNDNLKFEVWAGPQVVRPNCKHDLRAVLDGSPYDSLTLKQDDEVIGFGQLQLIGSRAHLARLAVAPQHRRKGWSVLLINKIITLAASKITLKSVSLFVYEYNHAAINSYNKLGFVKTAYPPTIKPIKQCIYMTMQY